MSYCTGLCINFNRSHFPTSISKCGRYDPLSIHEVSFVGTSAGADESQEVCGSNVLGLRLVYAIACADICEKVFEMMPCVRFIDRDNSKQQTAQQGKSYGKPFDGSSELGHPRDHLAGSAGL